MFVLRQLVMAASLVAILTGCSALDVLNALTLGGGGRAVKNLSYGVLAQQKLDLYLPSEPSGNDPVVVFFYGGNWNSGSRADYAFVGQALGSRGIITAVADYRLYPTVRYPAFLEDAARAVAWTARNVKNYGGDPDRLFVMGHSAGAYNASMVALDQRLLAAHDMTPHAIRGWIGLAGPYNFLPIINPDIQPIFFHPATPPMSQPVRHVSPLAPPALLIAASGDNLVNPARNSGRLAALLREAGVPVTEFYFDGVTHTTLIASLSTPLRQLAPTLDRIERFIQSNRANEKSDLPIPKIADAPGNARAGSSPSEPVH